jgi:nucleoside recognition membrane protein YjiH
MATSAHARPLWTPAGREAVVAAAYMTGGLMLAGEAAVHVQQYVVILHAVHWIGPLFLANAAACVVVIAALALPRARPAAALAGIGVSAVALASLVVSYGQGLFGWQEGGFRTPVELAVITELGAVVLLAAALTGELALRGRR